MACFLPLELDSHFSMQNLPYGVFRPRVDAQPRPGVAIGSFVLDLSSLQRAGLLLPNSKCFQQASLNSFLAMGRPTWKEARATIQRLLSAEDPALRDNEELKQEALFKQDAVTMELPVVIGDYTDFFSSRYHAANCGKIFRGKDSLPPNWLHVPIAYHGRASSVVVSGHEIVRPRGQTAPTDSSGSPEYKSCQLLDYELEMAMIIGPGNELGSPISVDSAYDHIFGMVLMNDWSARDIQRWESEPLGPFLGKNFGTTISPWIVTLDALEPFLCDAPTQDPPPLPYMKESNRKTYDISLEVSIRPEGQKPSVVCHSNFKHLYWTLAQQLAHHTVNGCNIRPGDLLASGTISGPEADSFGCLLEKTWGGRQHITLQEGVTRRFLEDGDEVIMTGYCQVQNRLALRKTLRLTVGSSFSRGTDSELDLVTALAKYFHQSSCLLKCWNLRYIALK